MPRATVLVVDDDEAIRFVCRVNLELDGFAVTEAASLAEARAALGGGKIDVVLLDVRVGDDDGRAFLSELRRDHSDVAVALLTGSVESLSVNGVGPDAALRKPFTLEELLETARALAG